MHLIESWGSGIPKILRESRQYGLKDPEITDSGSDFRISLFRREFDFDRYGVVDPRKREFEASNDTENGNRKETKDRFEASNEAGNTAKRILEAINETPDSNTEYLSRKLGLSRSTVQRNIKSLIEAGKLVREGAKKNGRWKIV